MFRFIKRLSQRRERKALYADMLSFVRKNWQQESGIRYCLPVSSSPASGCDGEVKYSLRDSDDAAMPKIVNVDGEPGMPSFVNQMKCLMKARGITGSMMWM